MNLIQYTLLTDGVSDRALVPVVTWVLGQHVVNRTIQDAWAELRRLPSPPKSLADKIAKAVELYPCDLLFVHRDSESQPRQKRLDEIQSALREVGDIVEVPVIPVVTVRMQEAWLLFDEQAIRRAAGNPNGRVPVQLPALTKVESIPDPKELLHGFLRTCSGLRGRRLSRLPCSTMAVRVADLIEDFSPLRSLSAFQELEARVAKVVRSQGWNV